MVKDINEIINNSNTIKNETVINANTAERVGGNTKDMAEYIKAYVHPMIAKKIFGFDREDMYAGGIKNGIMEFCYNASSGEVFRIGSDINGTYTKLTGQTTFGDGTTALADRTLVQYPDTTGDNTTFSYWYAGALVAHSTTKSIQVPSLFIGYIYFDATGEMSHVLNTPGPLIKDTTLISYLGLNSDEIWYYADERHGIEQGGEDHLQAHMNTGFFIKKFMRITGIANNRPTFTGVTGGIGADEDISMQIPAITTVPKLYRIGAEWKVINDDNSLAYLDGGVSQVNSVTYAGVGSLTDLTGNDRMGMVMITSNNKIHPTMMIVGQTHYGNRTTARQNVAAEWERMKVFGLPSPEIKNCFTFIIDPTGKIETGSDGEIYLDNQHSFPIPMFT